MYLGTVKANGRWYYVQLRAADETLQFGGAPVVNGIGVLWYRLRPRLSSPQEEEGMKKLKDVGVTIDLPSDISPKQLYISEPEANFSSQLKTGIWASSLGPLADIYYLNSTRFQVQM